MWLKHRLGLDPIPECKQDDEERRAHRQKTDDDFQSNVKMLRKATEDLRKNPAARSLDELEQRAQGLRKAFASAGRSSIPSEAGTE